LSLRFTTHRTITMASTDVEMYDPDSPDALSDALGTETLDVMSIVPDEYRETPDA
jgi:hypothetical protein